VVSVAAGTTVPLEIILDGNAVVMFFF
jgi:hypothetical protein